MHKASEPRLDTRAATHEVRNQATPLENHNLYRGDTALMEAVEREQAGWAQDDFCRYGAIPAPLSIRLFTMLASARFLAKR